MGRHVVLTGGVSATPLYCGYREGTGRVAEGPSRLVVPLPPGSRTDPIAHFMAARLGDTTRSQVVDESKPTLAGMPRPFPERTTGDLVDAMRSPDVMPRAEQEPCFRVKKENNIKTD